MNNKTIEFLKSWGLPDAGSRVNEDEYLVILQAAALEGGTGFCKKIYRAIECVGGFFYLKPE